ncbi:MAG TPA: polyphosphate--nucleotide phosphotransferase [Planctomycetaceae bacterium]|nr:polyphosphate--nucleotide phosphotransferase [Planctomycetaceae bacterium]
MFRVAPGEAPHLATRDPAWAGDEDRSEKKRKKQASKILEDSVEELAGLQELLYASDTWSVLVVFQALDAAGKDGAIKHVMSGVNPQGVEVTSFKEPSSEDLDHTFLWRCMKKLPERGRIGIFNRSYYEEVLIVRVHPDLLEAQRIPNVHAKDQTWHNRFDDINAFEKHLARNGTKIVKIFLHVSKEEQKNRFLDRINRPDKHWKFASADIQERQYFDDYTKAYEEMIAATSTEYAPWYVIPADNKWVSRAAVATILAGTIEELDLNWPAVTGQQKKEIEVGRKKLEAE